MAFLKTARVDVLGVQRGGDWSKVAAGKFASYYMDKSGVLDIEAALDSVADAYRISRNPEDYLLIPVRANSADRPNENMDGWRKNELLRFDPRVGNRVYSTYLLKPHFVNHNAQNYSLARGVILDSHYNDANPASDFVKESVREATGRDTDRDEFVECLIAMDTTKDPALAEAYRNGSVYRFSMGCDVESTECSVCGRVATTTFQFCDHVRGKLAKVAYPLEGGGHRRAFEWCNGTVFAELSVVDDPADKLAEVQEGLLRVAAGRRLSASEVNEIVSFVAKHPREIPEALAGLIDDVLRGLVA